MKIGLIGVLLMMVVTIFVITLILAYGHGGLVLLLVALVMWSLSVGAVFIELVEEEECGAKGGK